MGRGAGPFEATVVVEEVKDPEALFRALLPESGRARRFRADVRLENDRVIIHITASDPTALRAAVNSYLRLLNIVHSLEESL